MDRITLKIAKYLLALSFAVFFPICAAAQEEGVSSCKMNKEVVGECFTFHGRLRLGNGTPAVRIWRIGTSRILGVHQVMGSDGVEVFLLPKSLRARLDWGVSYFGDFESCPLTKEKQGEMQVVCVESVSNLVVIDNRERDSK